VVIAAAGVVSYRLMRTAIEADIYRQRLSDLADRYNDLRTTYNRAVRRTAVTELLVEDGEICVSIRTAEGEIKRIATPYRAGAEIFVDYVVIDGRMWIRRVFDSDTSPNGGVVIDPKLAQVDWDELHAASGKAAYRKLDEGRWVVTVTGNGSLGLVKREGSSDELVSPPSVRDYPPTMDQINSDIAQIGTVDVFKRAMGGS